MPTYFVQNAKEILSPSRIRHYRLDSHKVTITEDWLPERRPLDVALTCGASCPDAIVDEVLIRVPTCIGDTRSVDEALALYPIPVGG